MVVTWQRSSDGHAQGTPISILGKLALMLHLPLGGLCAYLHIMPRTAWLCMAAGSYLVSCLAKTRQQMLNKQWRLAKVCLDLAF